MTFTQEKMIRAKEIIAGQRQWNDEHSREDYGRFLHHYHQFKDTGYVEDVATWKAINIVWPWIQG